MGQQTQRWESNPCRRENDAYALAFQLIRQTNCCLESVPCCWGSTKPHGSLLSRSNLIWENEPEESFTHTNWCLILIKHILFVLCGLIDANGNVAPSLRSGLELELTWHSNDVILLSQLSPSSCSFTKCSHVSHSFTICVTGRGLMISIPLVLL